MIAIGSIVRPHCVCPTSGKTTVARCMGVLFHFLGCIPFPDVVECKASDLVGQYLGHTVPKTREMLESAKGKVLFIDEAISRNIPGSDSRAMLAAVALAVLACQGHACCLRRFIRAARTERSVSNARWIMRMLFGPMQTVSSYACRTTGSCTSHWQAYQLQSHTGNDNDSHNFGKEAVDTIVQVRPLFVRRSALLLIQKCA